MWILADAHTVGSLMIHFCNVRFHADKTKTLSTFVGVGEPNSEVFVPGGEEFTGTSLRPLEEIDSLCMQ